MPAINRGAVFFQGSGAGLHYVRYTALHSDFTAAAVTEAVSQSVTLPAGTIILGHSHRLETPFTGGTISDADITVGINGGNLDQYVALTDVFAAAFGYVASPGDGTAPLALAATTTIDITLATTGDNVVNADAGAYVVDLYYLRVDTDPAPVLS